jgi:predicted Zn-dependent protease
MYYRAAQYDKALPILEAVIERRPNDALTLQELAYAAGKGGNAAKEQEIYRKILERRPDATVARAQLAESLVKQGKSSEAVESLRQGIEQNPNSAVLHSTLGSVLEKSGRPQEALAAYKQAAQLDGASEQGRKVAARIAFLEKGQPAAQATEEPATP